MVPSLLVDEPSLTPPLRLPVLVRQVLVSLVLSLAQGVNAPGFVQDLVNALAVGDVAGARRILSGFGTVAFAPFADRHFVSAVSRALDNVFVVVEQAAEDERAAAASRDPADHEARQLRLLAHLDATGCRERTRRRRAPPAPAPAPAPVAAPAPARRASKAGRAR